MVPGDIPGQDPEPVAGPIDVQRRVDPEASVQHEPHIPAEVADRAPRAPRHPGSHPQLTHPPHQIRHIPHGPAGQHGGHGNDIGLLTRAFAVGDDAVDRVPLRRPIQVIIGGDIRGDLIQAGGARRQVHLVQQLLELAQRRRPSHPGLLQRPRPLRTLLRARPAAPSVATHRTIVSDPAPSHGVNSVNSQAR